MRPSKILASVTSEASAAKLREALPSVEVHKGENEVVAACDVVILACPPNLMSDVLGGLDKVLQGKLLISVLAGVSTESIKKVAGGAWVVRSLPNLAAAQQASATAVEDFDQDMPAEKVDLATAVIEQFGGVVLLPASIMDASTVVCGSTPAFIALFLDGLIDGAVAAGVPRNKANAMIAQVMGSTTALLGEQKASELRESVCAMPGCTIQGSIALEEGGVRGTAAKTMKMAIEAAKKLG